MIHINHILLLSQPEFVAGQVRAALGPGRRGGWCRRLLDRRA